MFQTIFSNMECDENWVDLVFAHFIVTSQMVRLLQIIKIIAHISELLNARYISGQIVGLISRRSWVRVPLSQYA